MDSILLWLGVASTALLLLATAVAWWEHRNHMARVRKQQLESQDSRFVMAAHSQAVDAKLLRASSALKAQAAASAQAATAAKTTRSAAAAAERAAPKVAAVAAGVMDCHDAVARACATGAATARVKPGLAAVANVRAAASAISVVSAVSAVLSSRAELAEMEKQPTWEDTQPMVLDTRSLEFEPTQLDTYSFDFAPTQPADLSPH